MNPIVTKEDFVKTYKDGLEKVEKYERAMDLLAEDVTLESIIRKIGISRKTLYKWRKEKTKPDALKGWELARRKGWVPLSYSSEKFLPINRIVAWVLSGGSILPNYQVSLSGRGEDLEKFGKDVKKISMKPVIRKREKSRGGPSLTIQGEGASPFGRLIHCLGAPKGGKAERRYGLPEYIENASEKGRKDFLEVYLSNRMIVLGKNRGFVLRMERHGEYKEAGERFYEELNNLLKRTVGEKGNIFTTEKHVELYYDRGRAKKILDSLEIQYNQEKKQKIRQKYEEL